MSLAEPDGFLDGLNQFSQDPRVVKGEAELEEIVAKEELAKITPRNEDLLRIAERFPAPQQWYDE